MDFTFSRAVEHFLRRDQGEQHHLCARDDSHGSVRVHSCHAGVELLRGGTRAGDSIAKVGGGQGDGLFVQAGGESYLTDARGPEEGPEVVDFARSRGVDSLNGTVVTKPRN